LLCHVYGVLFFQSHLIDFYICLWFQKDYITYTPWQELFPPLVKILFSFYHGFMDENKVDRSMMFLVNTHPTFFLGENWECPFVPPRVILPPQLISIPPCIFFNGCMPFMFFSLTQHAFHVINASIPFSTIY
jgi:hypothetical protein